MLKKVICTLIVLLLISSCEQEGQVNITDCREKIEVGENDFSNLFKTFTCDTYKSKDGYIINGECSSIELNGDKCVKSYTYDQKSNYQCGENEYLGYQGCLCNSGYVNINGECTNLKCDGEGEYKKDDDYCGCKEWYNQININDGLTKCERMNDNVINTIKCDNYSKVFEKVFYNIYQGAQNIDTNGNFAYKAYLGDHFYSNKINSCLIKVELDNYLNLDIAQNYTLYHDYTNGTIYASGDICGYMTPFIGKYCQLGKVKRIKNIDEIK